MHRRWDAPGVRRIFAKMLDKHAVWLLESVPVAILASPAPEQDDSVDCRGRLSQIPAAFTLVSSPTRRRNVSQLLDQGFTGEQLVYAAQMTEEGEEENRSRHHQESDCGRRPESCCGAGIVPRIPSIASEKAVD